MFDNLKTFRTGLGVTQQQMADAMGMPLRSYQDVEGGKNPLRPIHVNAACYAAIKIAADDGGYRQLPADIGELVRRAAT